MDLKDRVALLTGAKRIGAVVAEELAKHGVNIAICYARSRAEADAAIERVRAHGVRGEIFQADLSDPPACGDVVERVAQTFGRLDILVNMASVYREKKLDDLSVADWNANIDVDLRAAFLCSKAAVPHMRRQGGGRIVNFTDWLAKSGRPRYPGYLPYYVAKAGVMALTEALALEVASDNILVNAVAPGPILAPPDTSDYESQAVERATPLGRWGGEAEIARMVLAFLDSEFITGETVRVDGGRHVK
jgi:NAD(P)-dependent dehydrogenase (short-subunit alcohol dehydrogenase family)